MQSPFQQKSNLPRRPFQVSIKVLVPVTLVLAGILLVSAVVDIISARRELVHILQEESKALITALEEGSRNSLVSYALTEELVAERLLNNARLIEELDYLGALSDEKLYALSEQNRIFRINIYNEKGKRIKSSHAHLHNSQPQASPELMHAIRIEGNDELIMGLHSSRFGPGQRFAVAKRRRLGGVIVLNIDAQQMLDFRKTVGLGKLIQNIGKNPGIEYIVLQDTANILIATEGVDSMSTMSADSFLTLPFKSSNDPLQSGELYTRFVDYEDEKVLEIIHPFSYDQKEILRLGLGTQHIEETQRNSITRIVISSLLLLIFGAIVANWVISHQNYRELQKAYQRIESYAGNILENMSDAVVAINRNGNLTLVNSFAEQLFQVRAAKLLGKPCETELKALCPYLRKALLAKRSHRYEEEKIFLSGQEYIVSLYIGLVMSPGGELDSVFAVVKDITEQKKLEENLKRQNQISAMGHLASGVAHEIRNPLNAIGMIAQRFKTEFKPQEDEYNAMASTIVNETRRINDIIQQFLRFAKPGKLNKTKIDIKSVLQNVMTLLQQSSAEKGIRITSDCPSRVDIEADADRLGQVFLNIGQNALQACSRGDRVHFSCREEDNRLEIKITDNGKGIKEEELDKIFNLYYTTRETGTGIGLSIVQQIISQHHGTIDVQSKPEEGTVFTIYLPVTE
ncbi:PAS domain S-box protein [candidate division KSB1 bacterium]|nr:PAS domain S-box protein [candidate division KSB1 bacterium]